MEIRAGLAVISMTHTDWEVETEIGQQVFVVKHHRPGKEDPYPHNRSVDQPLDDI
jgi:hypothetical protein